MANDKTIEDLISCAVLTGGHGYDVLNFHRLFRGLAGVDAYIQHMDDFASARANVRDSYDVVLFYTMLMEGPTDDGGPWYAGRPKTALEHLGETEQGIVLLHHAILAYPQWPVWSEIAGIQDRSFGHHPEQTLRVAIAAPEHPITRDRNAWEDGRRDIHDGRTGGGQRDSVDGGPSQEHGRHRLGADAQACACLLLPIGA